MNPTALWRGCFWFSVALTSYLSLMPQEYLPEGVDIWDKLSHAVAFGVIALSAALGWPHKGFLRSLAMPLLGFGMLIEVMQLLIPGREFSLLDILADGVGILLAGAVIGLRRSVAKPRQ